MHFLYIQIFGHCVVRSLRPGGRKEFVSGLSAFQKLHISLKDEYRCHGNITSISGIHPSQHMRSKRK